MVFQQRDIFNEINKSAFYCSLSSEMHVKNGISVKEVSVWIGRNVDGLRLLVGGRG